MTSEPTSSTIKMVHIFTGPPGSGKLAHIYHSPYLRRLPIYCCYHHNKAAWTEGGYDEIILCAYSASYQAKEHWVARTTEAGYFPRLYVMKTKMEDTLTRMRARPHDNDLLKEIHNWYDWYTPHPLEEPIYIPPYHPEREKGAYR
jgi:hypothetical protein